MSPSPSPPKRTNGPISASKSGQIVGLGAGRGAAVTDVRLSAWVHGRVQSVGFRWWTRARALELGLTGYASNKPDGRVHVVAQGPRPDCERLLELLRGGTTPGTVSTVVDDWAPAGEPIEGFAER